MIIEKGFNFNLRTLTLAVHVKAICELYDKYAGKIGDARFDESIKEAKMRAEKIIEDSDADKASSTLEASDLKRDTLYKALGTLLKAYTLIPISADNEKAAPLYAIFSKYGTNATTLSYAEETGKIRSMLGDFSKPELKDSIASLYGVKETLDALSASQDEFEEASKAFTSATASERGKTSASEQKKALNLFFNDKIVRYVNFMVNLGETKFEDFAKEINVEIQKANANNAKPQSASQTITN